ncbi:MAG: LysR family transcriptional regulator [Acidimicrobiia bacterium]|nr:LysR family transcriptional regulator [Acidimicrobiia bacterium]
MPALQLDLESIRTLIAVVDHGGMTNAARHLDLSQSAVSHKIKRLEEKVGRPLLIRDGHAVRPNRDGVALIEDGRAMLDLHDRAAARLVYEKISGRVRIGANQDFYTDRLTAVLGRFSRLHPDAIVQFAFATTEQLSQQVDRGDIDLAIIQVIDEQLRPDDVVLWTDQVCWVTSSQWDQPSAPVPLISFSEDCLYQLTGRPQLERAGLDYFLTFSGSSTSAVLAAVEAGLGVGLVTSQYLSDEVVEWTPPVELDPLPRIHQVLRTVPGENPEVTRALTDLLARELR